MLHENDIIDLVLQLVNWLNALIDWLKMLFSFPGF